MKDCFVCEIIDGALQGCVLQTWHEAVLIEPLDPIGPGHRLIVPRQHIEDAGEDPRVMAGLMRRAVEVAGATGDVRILPTSSHGLSRPIRHLRLEITPRADVAPPAPLESRAAEEQLTALLAAVAVLTTPGYPGAIGAAVLCDQADALARFLAVAGYLDDGVRLLMSHALYDDADQPHHDLTLSQAQAQLSKLT